MSFVLRWHCPPFSERVGTAPRATPLACSASFCIWSHCSTALWKELLLGSLRPCGAGPLTSGLGKTPSPSCVFRGGLAHRLLHLENTGFRCPRPSVVLTKSSCTEGPAGARQGPPALITDSSSFLPAHCGPEELTVASLAPGSPRRSPRGWALAGKSPHLQTSWGQVLLPQSQPAPRNCRLPKRWFCGASLLLVPEFLPAPPHPENACSHVVSPSTLMWSRKPGSAVTMGAEGGDGRGQG